MVTEAAKHGMMIVPHAEQTCPMRLLRFIVPLVLLFVSLVPATDATTADPFVRPKDASGPLVHRYSRYSFPARLGRFHRVMPLQYDAFGRDVSVGYNLEFPPIVITIYVYPAGRTSLEQELARLQGEITGMHSNPRLVARGTTTVSPRKVRALSVEYTYTEKFAGTVQLLRSTLLVARNKQLFVEYRITYAASSTPVADKLARLLVQDFAWP